MAHVIKDRVKETSTTTGTGALTLAGAMTGFQAFSAACAVGDTLYYALQAVDASGVPTGDWECGLGTYSAANTLTRTTVTSSSNAGAAVSLAAGTKQVYITMPAAQVAWARERLTTDRTYYVRTDGSDSNSGLENTAGGAFLTVQKAADTVGAIDISTYNVTVQLSDATRTEKVTLRGITGSGTVTFTGNVTTPGNVIMSATSGHCFHQNHVIGNYIVKNMALQTTTSGWGLAAQGSGVSLSFGNIEFGACASGHIYADSSAAVTATSNYKILGSAPIHFKTTTSAFVVINAKTITLTGAPEFATAYAYASHCGVASVTGCTYSGSATGVRYSVSLNAVIDSGTPLPGSVAGTEATGGRYV